MFPHPVARAVGLSIVMSVALLSLCYATASAQDIDVDLHDGK